MARRKPLTSRRDARRLASVIARQLDQLTDYLMTDREMPVRPFETLIDASNVTYFFGKSYEIGNTSSGK